MTSAGFKKAWVRAKEAAAETFNFRGQEHETATGAAKPAPAGTKDLRVNTAVKNVRSFKSKIDEAEAKALGQ